MSSLAFIQNINGPEILLIFLIVLLLFGAKRLPELFKSFGKSIREFKKATSEIEEDVRNAMEEEPRKPEPTAPAAAPKQVESANSDETKADKA
ncbi:twin-arginine translocase TatA/TatE family subunit [Coraliomargarita sp. SDUM461003]|uniref:Sec-independent protein translocase protein TatA n=1 Tax=Thalassobacterium maritimum TaxID=3041265 RepID=A0ABU1AYK1_9BACT|nr:twin-arginine translocase TatA/TatE family subunit [Coraliomargarita sp. SDUM461003]MDQ8208042.1 twin-arginine translocase TatA/TatE family subunit [Coraliomargarita sp. SDUM461003]